MRSDNMTGKKSITNSGYVQDLNRLLLPSSVMLIVGLFLLRANLPVVDDSGIPASDTSTLIFSHERHVVEEELECLDCHGDVEDSETGADNLIPDHETCSDCHEVEEPDECLQCHESPDGKDDFTRVVDYSQKFSHERHLSAELTCESCHAAMPEKTEVEPIVLPTMVACLDCHEDQSVSVTCQTCHLDTDRLTPPSHDMDFQRTHADLARFDANLVDGDKTCQTCHQTDYCQDCHESENVDQVTHPLNWEFTHALEAQSAEVTCQSCHSDFQFCADCHAQNLIMPHSHSPGWVNRIPGDGGRHRLEALNDLQTCMSCHTDNAETVCESCHDGTL
jgi:Cytochrome c7 and related cytochrome c